MLGWPGRTDSEARPPEELLDGCLILDWAAPAHVLDPQQLALLCQSRQQYEVSRTSRRPLLVRRWYFSQKIRPETMPPVLFLQSICSNSEAIHFEQAVGTP